MPQKHLKPCGCTWEPDKDSRVQEVKEFLKSFEESLKIRVAKQGFSLYTSKFEANTYCLEYGQSIPHSRKGIDACNYRYYLVITIVTDGVYLKFVQDYARFDSFKASRTIMREEKVCFQHVDMLREKSLELIKGTQVR